jgi:8-oxo-dGTP diphosphatase
MGSPGIDFPGLGVGLVILRDRKILLYKRVQST